MKSKRYFLVIYVLLLNAFACSMESDYAVCTIDKDSLEHIFSFVKLSTVNAFFKTCKNYYFLHPTKMFLKKSIDDYLLRNKDRCYLLNSKQHINAFIHYAQQNNSLIMGVLINNESDWNANNREYILSAFGYRKKTDIMNIKQNIRAYKGIKNSRKAIDKNDLFFNKDKLYNLGVIEILLQNGANGNVRLSNGRNLLHQAIDNRCPLWFITLLVQQGVRVNARDNVGLTPIDLAIRCSNRYVIYLLIEHGARLTPLFKKYKASLNARILKNAFEKRKQYSKSKIAIINKKY